MRRAPRSNEIYNKVKESNMYVNNNKNLDFDAVFLNKLDKKLMCKG